MKAVEIRNSLRDRLRQKTKVERLAIGKIIQKVQESFGQPHLHSGLGLRKLVKNYYEVRIGLKERLIFRDDPEEITFIFLGNHNEVQRFLDNV